MVLIGRDFPAIGVDTDNYLVVWGEYHDDYDIYGNVDITIGIKEEEYPLLLLGIQSVQGGIDSNI